MILRRRLATWVVAPDVIATSFAIRQLDGRAWTIYDARMERKPPPPRLQDLPPDARLMSCGGPVDRATVSLRIFGDPLDPAEITSLLGHVPTESRRKGDVIPDKRYHRVASTGSWLLKSNMREFVGVEHQVGGLLKKLTDDLEVWGKLADTFDVDLFCGLFLDDFNRGFSLSPTVMRAISDRQLVLHFDIYCPVKPAR